MIFVYCEDRKLIIDYCLLTWLKIDIDCCWFLGPRIDYWWWLIFRTENWWTTRRWGSQWWLKAPQNQQHWERYSIFLSLVAYSFNLNQHTSFGPSLSRVLFPCIRFAQLRTTYPTMTTTIFCDRRQYPNREMAEFEKNWNIEMIHTFRCIISPNDVIIWISSSYSLTNICFNASPMHFKFSIIVMFLHKSVTM